ncbi:MAG: phenylpyruvate tautomerase MIF-related protein [Ruminococcus sp.]|nr:phenylpyruvate tautomerase MIF-related protein [Ruminococcus sp.]
MPFINTKVTTEISKEKEAVLKAELGKAITLIGKGEAYLMLGFEDNCRLWLGGNNDADMAYVEVSLLGRVTKENAGKLTAAICEIFQRELNIQGDKVYIKFSETDLWGYDSFMF